MDSDVIEQSAASDIVPRNLTVSANAWDFGAIIERAMAAPDLDLERLDRLLSHAERWEMRESIKAFEAAMVEFKRNPPTLHKNKAVAYGQTKYKHATHDEVTGKIGEALARHGINHDWKMVQTDTSITVTCTLTHLAGHSKSSQLTADYDTSGGKNSIQAVASANSYLQRYTLLAVTGMSTSDMPDDDGRLGADAPIPAIPTDVKTVLDDASKLGLTQVKEQWALLNKETRELITVHHAAYWTTVKKNAAAVDACKEAK
jgi:ERF superfamily